MAEDRDITGQKTSSLAVLQNTKLPLWVSLLLVLLVIVAFVWKQAAVSQVDKRMQEQAQQFETEKAAIRTQAADALAKNSDAAHQLLGTALSWAIRGELIRNNLDQIDQYFAELVKVERIKLAVLSNQDGKILVSSDKKYQDGEFGQAFPAELLNEAQVAIHPGPDGSKLIVMPIMGLNSRLGTAVVSYMPEQLEMGSK
jgi:hypothetical protein